MIGKLFLNEPMHEGWRKRNKWRKKLNKLEIK